MLDFVVGDVVEVGAFGEEVTDQAVGVLVGWALPGAVGVAEVDFAVCGDAELGVLGHLGALVPGEGLEQVGWEVLGHLDQGVTDSHRVVVG